MTYDSYGRLKTKHAPEQQADANNSASTDHTIWTYNNDDTIASITDARGAVQTFSYSNNNRQLVSAVTYSAPSGITVPASVSFSYDAAANRKTMSDGLGSVSYNYDTLSRLETETRNFAGVGSFPINYSYNLANELVSVTDPAGAVVNYSHDLAGRFSSASGSGYGSTTQFAFNVQYRAWGGVKHLSYGNSVNLDQQFNGRLQVSRYALNPVFTTQYSQVNRAQNYQYYADGRVKFMQDEANNLFDRSYAYDQLGRIKQALTGHEARGEEFGALSAYNETFTYDEWDNATSRNTRHWTHQYNSGVFTYQNNRRPGYLYDSDGRVSADHTNTGLAVTLNYTYDVRGLKTSARKGDNSDITTHEFDGDGRRAKIVKTTVDQGVTTTSIAYEIRSAALGGAVVEAVNPQGVKTKQYVYTSSGLELASGTAESAMIFKHVDPVTESEQLSWIDARDAGRTELDPTAGDVGTYQPLEDDPGNDFPVRHGTLSRPMDLCARAELPSVCTGQAYAFWGTRIVDLPGFGSNWGSMAEWGQQRFNTLLSEAFERRATQTRQRDGSSHGTVDLEMATVTIYADEGDFEEVDAGFVTQSLTLRPVDIIALNNKVHANYDGCKSILTSSPANKLKKDLKLHFVDEATAMAVLDTSALERVDATLIAVTWAAESSFSLNPGNHYRYSDRGEDIGPMQIANTIWNKSPYTDGLGDVFGSDQSRGGTFNGNPYANLRAGARALNDAGGSRANKAGIFRAGATYQKNDGGPEAYNRRVTQFNSWSGTYDKFFECLRK